MYVVLHECLTLLFRYPPPPSTSSNNSIPWTALSKMSSGAFLTIFVRAMVPLQHFKHPCTVHGWPAKARSPFRQRRGAHCAPECVRLSFIDIHCFRYPMPARNAMLSPPIQIESLSQKPAFGHYLRLCYITALFLPTWPAAHNMYCATARKTSWFHMRPGPLRQKAAP